MNKQTLGLIIPTCSDLNRGDQALTIETMNVMKKSLGIENVYMMSNNETNQCEQLGLKQFSCILKHPSRLAKKTSNLKYNMSLNIKWGIIAIGDLIRAQFIKNNITRKFMKIFIDKQTKDALELYEKADVVFVKGGGFLHDYSGGLIGAYTMYYQLYHIKLALKMNKKVYIMPNSFGPFKSKRIVNYLNKTLDKCAYITARESISANKETNGLNRNIDLYPDLGFFLKMENKETIKQYLKKEYNLDFEQKKYVGITVRPYRFYNSENPEERYENYKYCFVKIIDYLNEIGYTPILVVHTRAENTHENDEACINEIAGSISDKNKFIIIKDDNLNCKQLKTIYSFCDFIIGTRFHSVIFSIENRIPCIAITYGGNKGDGIMRDMGLEKYAIKISELEYEILKEKVIMLKNNENFIKEKINEYLKYAYERYNELINKIKGDN